jgi:predicted nucleotidyltransferase
MTRAPGQNVAAGLSGDMLGSLRAALSRRSDVAFAYLFGSAATGKMHRLSDVDVGVFVCPVAGDEGGNGEREWETQLDVLAAVQQTLPGHEVDVVVLNRVPPLLADRIVRSGLVLFSRDEPGRIRWVVEAKSRYCDLEPVRGTLDRAEGERIRSGRFGARHG